MPLAPLRPLLGRARAEGWALPAFNVANLEVCAAVLDAAEPGGGSRAPIVLQANPGAIRHAGFARLAALLVAAARDAAVPVVVMLDHCADPALHEAAIAAGFSALMADGSRLPFDENVTFTRRIAERGHRAGLAVEGELTAIGGREEGVAASDERTDPDTAARFVEATGVDALAVAVGNAHGDAPSGGRLDLELLARIAAAVPVPLVLHGTSGVPENQLRAAIAAGVAKCNVSSVLYRAFASAIAAGDAGTDPRPLLRGGRAAVADVAAEVIGWCGARGRG